MKPHLAYIQKTLAKKAAMEKASTDSYSIYMKKVDKARELGYPEEAIIKELESERDRIMSDIRHRSSDPLIAQGVRNAKVSCVTAINLILSEMRGQFNGSN